jgi:argininosuccinate lyase
VLEGLHLNQEACRKAAQQGYANATELADYLVSKGVPFRTAHDIAGQAVVKAIHQGIALEELNMATLQSLHASIEEDVYQWLPLETVVSKRNQLGGTSHDMVTKALYLELEQLDQLKVNLK